MHHETKPFSIEISLNFEGITRNKAHTIIVVSLCMQLCLTYNTAIVSVYDIILHCVCVCVCVCARARARANSSLTAKHETCANEKIFYNEIYAS